MSTRQRSAAQAAGEADVESHRRELGPFVVAAEETRMPMVFTNALEKGHPLIFANDAFLKLTGYARQELLGTSFEALIAPGNAPSVRGECARAFSEEHVNPEFACRARDGREIWVSLHVGAVRDAQGDVVQHFASLFDLSRHVSEQRSAQVLIDELNHRVRNNLAVIQSIVRLGSKRLASPSELGRAIEDRIVAIAHTQSLLEQARWSALPLRQVIETPVSAILKAGRFTMTGPDLSLSAAQAWTLSLTIQELLLGAQARKIVIEGPGHLCVLWKRAGDSLVVIEWDEIGPPPASPPASSELGSSLMQRQVQQELAGKLAISTDADGFHCRMELPLQGYT